MGERHLQMVEEIKIETGYQTFTIVILNALVSYYNQIMGKKK